MSRRPPDFDDLVGNDLTPAERDRLRRVHDLMVAAGPPPELTTELESVQWPEEALAPLGLTRRAGADKRRHSRLMLVAAAVTVAAAAFLLGQATSTNSTSMDVRKVVRLSGTALDRDALATLELGHPDLQGNWPMVLHASGLRSLPEAGYYDLYLTRNGKPVALCATFNVNRHGEVNIRFSAAYQLDHFDQDGWVVTRQIPPNHEPTEVVLRPAGGSGSA